MTITSQGDGSVSFTAARKVMILSKKTGQLGNRLTVFSHCLAAARERGYRFLNPSFCEYAPFFEGPRCNVWQTCIPSVSDRVPHMWTRNIAYGVGRISYKSAKLLRFFSFGRISVARARNEEHLDLKDVLDRADTKGCRLLILQGYHFRHHGWFSKHEDFIRAYLKPAKPWRDTGQLVIENLRETCSVIVGIHIRHGDYREHLGGRFYWEIPTYLGFMARVVKLCAPESVGFVICSNVGHQQRDFDGFNWRPGPGHLVSDMHALALCDFILGPPSSFSSWAAWYGRNRLLRLENSSQVFSLDDFKRLDTPDPLY